MTKKKEEIEEEINAVIKHELKQKDKNMLFKYGYYFDIMYYKQIDNVVYYKIYYGKSYKGTTNLEKEDNIVIRFSELRKINICNECFPSRTMFKNTSKQFIRQRLENLSKWVDYILEKNQAENLFKAIEAAKLSISSHSK